MDDLTAVRELEADVPALTDAARSAARVRLQHAIVQEGRRPRGVVPVFRQVPDDLPLTRYVLGALPHVPQHHLQLCLRRRHHPNVHPQSGGNT